MIPGNPGYIKGQNLKIGVERDALAEVGPGAQGQIGPVKDGGAGAGPEFGVFKSQRYGAFLKRVPKIARLAISSLPSALKERREEKSHLAFLFAGFLLFSNCAKSTLSAWRSKLKAGVFFA